ncbi:helix-turn-helix domain-containing protein [Rhodococcus pyridinivorans]|uniref:helix-turn-helix domain-containing protein n=1 Tax=Rhodococcus pyridinivorans TaxID=103816 RepID=UPI003AAFA82F
MPRTRPKSTPKYELARQLSAVELAFKQSLIQLRKDADLTQDAVSKLMGVDKSAVSRFERIDSNPRLSTIRAYALAVDAMVEMKAEKFVPEVHRHSDSSYGSSTASIAGHMIPRNVRIWRGSEVVQSGVYAYFEIDRPDTADDNVLDTGSGPSILGYANA